MATLKPVLGFAHAEADTSRTLPSSKGLNTPQLLVVDSTNHLYPVYFCGEEVPIGEPRVAQRWAQTLRTYGAQPEFLLDLRHESVYVFSNH